MVEREMVAIRRRWRVRRRRHKRESVQTKESREDKQTPRLGKQLPYIDNAPKRGTSIRRKENNEKGRQKIPQTLK